MDEAFEAEVRPLFDLIDSLRQLGLNEAWWSDEYSKFSFCVSSPYFIPFYLSLRFYTLLGLLCFSSLFCSDVYREFLVIKFFTYKASLCALFYPPPLYSPLVCYLSSTLLPVSYSTAVTLFGPQ
jgi:hypothetical protein